MSGLNVQNLLVLLQKPDFNNGLRELRYHLLKLNSSSKHTTTFNLEFRKRQSVKATLGVFSVVNEPSRLESFKPGDASSPSRLELSLDLARANSRLLASGFLAARTGVYERTRVPWRLESARTGVHEPTRLQTRASWRILGGFLAARAWLESSSPGAT